MADNQENLLDTTDISPLLDGTEQTNGLHKEESINEKPTIQSTRKSIFYWKNLLCLSVSYTFLYITFCAIQNLESTANQNAGLGVVSLACIYGGVVTTCLFAPAVVKLIGYKWSIVSGCVVQLIYTVSNIYPRFYTLVPASVILGVVSSVSWTGQGPYMTSLATNYAKDYGQDLEHVLTNFNGIFYFFFQNSQIWGNLISSLVLHKDDDHHHSTDNTSKVCGFHFCDLDKINKTSNHNTSTDTKSIPTHLLYTLIAIYAVFDIIGITICACFVTDMPKEGAHTSFKERALSTFKIHRNKFLASLVLLFTYNGFSQGFFFGEYTQAFPGCVLGVGKIGYVMIAYGVTNASSAFLMGRFEKLLGRIVLFSIAAAINISMTLTMWFWDPHHGPEILFYVIPAIWGLADAIWQTTTCSFIGVVFHTNQEPAFASFRMWQAFGFMLSFATSHFLCMDIKIYIVIGAGTVSMCLYYVVEVLLRRDPPKLEVIVEEIN